jgi:hypothetical protein
MPTDHMTRVFWNDKHRTFDTEEDATQFCESASEDGNEHLQQNHKGTMARLWANGEIMLTGTRKSIIKELSGA